MACPRASLRRCSRQRAFRRLWVIPNRYTGSPYSRRRTSCVTLFPKALITPKCAVRWLNTLVTRRACGFFSTECSAPGAICWLLWKPSGRYSAASEVSLFLTLNRLAALDDESHLDQVRLILFGACIFFCRRLA